MPERTIIFVDIDGVLSVLNPDNFEERRLGPGWPGMSAWPIPMTKPLLEALSYDPRFTPIWMSAWHDASLLWNFYARSPLWKVGYSLLPREWHHAKRCFPELGGLHWSPTWNGERVDTKLVAVRYHLRKHSGRAVWIEDGFADCTHAWAASNPQVRLIDPREAPFSSFWLCAEQPEQVAKQFIEEYLAREEQ